jgi:hypothetical protein
MDGFRAGDEAIAAMRDRGEPPLDSYVAVLDESGQAIGFGKIALYRITKVGRLYSVILDSNGVGRGAMIGGISVSRLRVLRQAPLRESRV